MNLMFFIKIIWLMIPVVVANMAPVIFNRVNFLNTPVSSKIFGKNKTYRGLFFGVLSAMMIVYVQKLAFPYIIDYNFINYDQINVYLFGFLLGFGALFGDLVESFFKRRLGIGPGKPWVPFDQIDWILIPCLVLVIYNFFDIKALIWATIIFGALHPAINYIGYLIKLKKNKF